MQTVTATKEAVKRSDKAKPWQFLTSSVLIWLLVALVGLDYAISTIRPLKHVKTIQYLPLDQNPVVSKIPEFFDSSIKPDALVLGSSLPMTAIAYCDYAYKGEPDASKIGQVRIYTKARYLEDNLNKLLNKPLSIFNLSCYGCMASEAYLLLSRAVDAGRQPKYVFYGIAPRDFVDNSVPPVGKTPVYEVLADWRCVNDIFTRNLQLGQIGDLFIGCLWYYYRVKADYRTFFTAATCDLLNHPATLYQSSTSKKTANQPSGEQGSVCAALESQTKTPLSKFDESLVEYKSRYNPPNFGRYGQELSLFKKLVQLCQEKNIQLFVFNMPVTDSNKNLLDKKLYDRYLADTSSLTEKFGGKYLNLDSPEYTTTKYAAGDYLDSAHLNASGGKKLQDNLLTHLATMNLNETK